MKIGNIMKNSVEMIDLNATVKDALEVMFKKNITSLLVNGKSIDDFGIITRSDIIHKVLAKEKNPEETKVKDIMSKPLLMISPEIDIFDCARIMEKSGLRHFPVIRDDKIVGFISNSDIFKAFTRLI